MKTNLTPEEEEKWEVCIFCEGSGETCYLGSKPPVPCVHCEDGLVPKDFHAVTRSHKPQDFPDGP